MTDPWPSEIPGRFPFPLKFEQRNHWVLNICVKKVDGAPKFLLIKVLDHLRVQNQSVNTRDLEVNPNSGGWRSHGFFWNRFEDDSESAVPLCSIAILRYLRSNIRNINWFNWFKRQHQALVGRGPLCKKTFCSGPASPRSTWNSVSQAGDMCNNHCGIQLLALGF